MPSMTSCATPLRSVIKTGARQAPINAFVLVCIFITVRTSNHRPIDRMFFYFFKESQMGNFVFPRLRMMTAMVVTAVLVAACGGGGTAADNVGSGGTGFISGAAVKGPVGHASITAYGINGGQMGAQIGTATTDVNGNFSMAIGNYAGPVLLQMSGGSYTDEATGASMSMALGDVMTAVTPSVAGRARNSGVQVTPLTAMAQAMAQHKIGRASCRERG